MAREQPHLHLFSVRCTLLAFHALIWSFLTQSKPEFLNSSLDTMSEESITKHLNAIVITGAIFLGINCVITLSSASLRCIPLHFLHIVCHSLAILLVIVSILNYWNIRLLWIPTSICGIFPTVIEIAYSLTVFIKSCSSTKTKKQ